MIPLKLFILNCVYFSGNHQHPLTLVTPLMCAAMWSLTKCIERLLSMDNILINLRAINNFSPIDFARKYATNETSELLETNIL